MNWNEKYRPQSLDDVIGQRHITDRLKVIAKRIRDGNPPDGDCPHMFYAGTAGTGKTSVAVAFLKDCFGDNWDANFHELNASDEGGIAYIRAEVKKWAGRGVIDDQPFNTIFLDEIDSKSFSNESQSALRRIMEKYAHNTRFILACNLPHKVIDALKDRCAFANMRFKRLTPQMVVKLLSPIATGEGLKIDAGVLMKIGELCGGSARKAQNILYTASLKEGAITVKDVLESANKLTQRFPLELIMKAKKGAYDYVDSCINEMYGEMTGAEILQAMYVAVNESDLPLDHKKSLLYNIGITLYYCSVTDDDLLQIKCMLRGI